MSKITHSKFKVGDFLKLKTGARSTYINGLSISNWRGRVRTISANSLQLELDAITVQELPDDFIQMYIDEGWSPYSPNFSIELLEYAHPRDVPEDAIRAQDDLIMRIDAERKIAKYRIEYNKWIRHFEMSNKFQTLTFGEMALAYTILNYFCDYMKNMERKVPENWSATSVKNVLTKWIPRKMVAPEEVFASSHNIILTFFEFLNEKSYRNTDKLRAVAEGLKDTMIEESQKKEKWTSEKTRKMEAIEAGIDMRDSYAILSFSLNQSIKNLSSSVGTFSKTKADLLGEKNPQDPNTVDTKPFKKLWQNQKITVQYPDGTIKENVKFKEVKADLYGGLCQLIKK